MSVRTFLLFLGIMLDVIYGFRIMSYCTRQLSFSQCSSSRFACDNSLCMVIEKRRQPLGFENRIQNGLLRSGDLERAYNPSLREIERLSRSSASGFVTVIFSLESSLVNMDVVLTQAYTLFAQQGGFNVPSELQVRDAIGNNFKDNVIYFGWNIPKDACANYEEAFYNVVEKLLENDMFARTITSQPGASLAIENTIIEKNEIIIYTELPRKIATKVLGITRLSTLLAARVNPEHLIHPEDTIPTTIQGAQILRSCAQARSAPMLTIFVDGNRRNLQSAKRCGLSTIGIKGYAANAAVMNACDKVMMTLLEFKMKDMYKIIQRNVEQSVGLKESTDSASTLIPNRPQQVVSPAEDDPLLRDTFADDSSSSDVL